MTKTRKNHCMKNTIRYLAAAVAVLVIITGCKNEPAQNSGTTIAVSIFTVYDIVKNISGDRVRTIHVIPAGANPHTYEPLP